ncbi:TIGR00341 family protein [Flavobacterium sp. F-380]|uniref:TIGR00341 family protein n=1 Tax=Flavobacterium kayseriense TaxID=2764714 RepID=A0ABR7J6K3_9FLAO|nr:TIGR00341 family protein [Flavobacterium kayseriense]MBC5841082.1 TIGR00341 family protein [Flavobacterium kayseriense]MBC5847610.1 TIGR00341 family protein [Flavobacterium kayseriense]
MKTLVSQILNYINLSRGEDDKHKVLDNVKSNISFRGANLWILACAIVIASIGLNVNSAAVIIGAMLISPLMGPIIGAGFGLGVFDFNLLKKSLKNLAVATFVGLIVSAIYFYLSPFKETQPELLSRTAPNIYDILIAFSGGLVGAIAITRVEKGNPIPGVAIATALMPPLCTAGYGIAIGSMKFFFGAIYLYSINCVFICISTFFIVTYLKYPKTKQLDDRSEKRVKYIISTLITILILPSIYFAYQLIQQKNYQHQIDVFIETEFSNKGIAILYKKTKFTENPKKLDLGFLSKKFTAPEIKVLNDKLKNYDINNTQLRVIQDTTDLKSDILNEIKYNKSVLSEKDVTILKLKKQINSSLYDNKALLSEIKILFPEIENISMTNHIFNDNTDSLKTVPVLIYNSKTVLKDEYKIKLTLWLEQRLAKSNIELYQQPNQPVAQSPDKKGVKK